MTSYLSFCEDGALLMKVPVDSAVLADDFHEASAHKEKPERQFNHSAKKVTLDGDQAKGATLKGIKWILVQNKYIIMSL